MIINSFKRCARATDTLCVLELGPKNGALLAKNCRAQHVKHAIFQNFKVKFEAMTDCIAELDA